MSHLKITEIVLALCIVGNNYYQQNWRILHTFAPNKFFDQLLDISPKICIILKTCNWEFSHIKVWFTDQTSNQLEINVTLVIKWSVKHKQWCLIHLSL